MSDTRPVAFVAGGLRGTGRDVVLEFAARGVEPFFGYRDERKVQRAGRLCMSIAEVLGEDIAAPIADRSIQGDLTIDPGNVVEDLSIKLGDRQLDYLILTAAGGMEDGATSTYAHDINCHALLDLAELAESEDIIGRGSTVIYTPSSQSHYLGDVRGVAPVSSRYLPVAMAKKQGEQALSEWVKANHEYRGIQLGHVSTDYIVGSTVLGLMARMAGITSAESEPDFAETRRMAIRRHLGLPDSVDPLLSSEQYAHLIVDSVMNPPDENPVFVVRAPDFGEPQYATI